MHRRQPLPRLWLMTDERQGEDLWRAVDRLPAGSGIVFRHYSLDLKERRELFDKVRRISRRNGMMLVLAGHAALARSWEADGWHSSAPQRSPAGLIRTAPAHNLREISAANQAGADLLFLSPVFPTRSHPDGRALGPLRFRQLARQTRIPVIALGGMNELRARRLDDAIYGWAGIDAWSRR